MFSRVQYPLHISISVAGTSDFSIYPPQTERIIQTSPLGHGEFSINEKQETRDERGGGKTEAKIRTTLPKKERASERERAETRIREE